MMSQMPGFLPYDDMAVFILFTCNAQKEYSSMRLAAATTNPKTLYAIVGDSILKGDMGYGGQSKEAGLELYIRDYLFGEVDFGRLDYGFVEQRKNEITLDEENEKPYEKMHQLLLSAEEGCDSPFDVTEQFIREFYDKEPFPALGDGYCPLEGIDDERLRWITDSALSWASSMYHGEELYQFLRDIIGMRNDEITQAGFDLQDYYEADLDLDDTHGAGEEDEFDEER